MGRWIAHLLESDLEEVYNTERHLLYVACTRARDHLLVTGVGVFGGYVAVKTEYEDGIPACVRTQKGAAA